VGRVSGLYAELAWMGQKGLQILCGIDGEFVALGVDE